MFLRAILKVEFEKSIDDQERLREFVLESFKIVVNESSLKEAGNKIKDLDYITLNIKVPSISKRNVIDNLDLSLLLK